VIKTESSDSWQHFSRPLGLRCLHYEVLSHSLPGFRVSPALISIANVMAVGSGVTDGEAGVRAAPLAS